MIYKETDRLFLRDWKPEDIEQLARLNADPRVMEFLLKLLTEQESFELYEIAQAEFIEYGYRPYVLERKSDGEFIGFTGFHNFDFKTDFSPGVKILWRLRYKYWGKGYAAEAARGCLEYARKSLPLDTIWSFTAETNVRSERVMQKIGLKKVGEFVHPEIPVSNPLSTHVLYKTELHKLNAI